MSPSEQTATVRGAEIAYHLEGSGPDLVFGHGLSGSRTIDDTTSPIAWHEIPARVLRYDARGHGRSSSGHAESSYTWEELAKDQLALADHCGLGSYVSSGASMGCATALHAAVLAPARIRALVLVIPPTAWETRSERAADHRALGDEVARNGVEVYVKARRLHPLPDPYAGSSERYDQLAAAARSWEAPRLAEVLRGAALADLPPREQLARITVPTLILAWSGDSSHPVSTAKALGELIPGSELFIASTPEDLVTWTERISSFVSTLP